MALKFKSDLKRAGTGEHGLMKRERERARDKREEKGRERERESERGGD